MNKKLILVSQENETVEHLALKLAAFILFIDWNPAVEISLKNPAMNQQEFKPDLLALDEGGEIRLWVECGNVTTHKLNKLIRRNRQARLVVLKANKRESENLRRALDKNDVSNAARIEIWSFPNDQFEKWLNVLEERVEIFGEPESISFNLVANDVPFNFDFERS